MLHVFNLVSRPPKIGPSNRQKKHQNLSENDNFGQSQVTFLRCTDGLRKYGYPSIYKCRNLSEYWKKVHVNRAPKLRESIEALTERVLKCCPRMLVKTAKLN